MESKIKVSKPKIKPMPLYLTEDMKADVELKAASLGMTSNGYIKMLINADLKK